MDRGPIEVVVFTFPSDVDAVGAMTSLRSVVESGVVKVVDLVLVLRDEAGEPELHDLEHDLPPELEWLTIDPHTLLNDDDIDLVIETLPSGEKAAVIVFEHAWAKDTVNQLGALGAELALYARIPRSEAELAFAAGPAAS
jgi:hypothetical protein